MAISEFRGFFSRATKTNTGAEPDQETGYPIEYDVKGEKKKNRFLAGHVPSEGVFTKFFNSIPFFLNKEDRASASRQGLIKKATDAEVIAKTANPNTDWTKAVVPHQIPEIISAVDGGTDVLVGSAITKEGLTVATYTRTVAGNSRTVYYITATPTKSIAVASELLQLVNDANTPGGSMAYGTDSGGTKGWIPIPVIVGKNLAGALSVTSSTTLIAVTSGTSGLQATLTNGKKYYFKALLHVSPSNLGGFKIKLDTAGGLTSSNLVYNMKYIDNTSNTIVDSLKGTALATNISNTGAAAGVCEIEGTIVVTGTGLLGVYFAQNVSNGVASVIEAGSSFIVQEITESLV